MFGVAARTCLAVCAAGSADAQARHQLSRQRVSVLPGLLRVLRFSARGAASQTPSPPHHLTGPPSHLLPRHCILILCKVLASPLCTDLPVAFLGADVPQAGDVCLPCSSRSPTAQTLAVKRSPLCKMRSITWREMCSSWGRYWRSVISFKLCFRV